MHQEPHYTHVGCTWLEGMQGVVGTWLPVSFYPLPVSLHLPAYPVTCAPSLFLFINHVHDCLVNLVTCCSGHLVKCLTCAPYLGLVHTTQVCHCINMSFLAFQLLRKRLLSGQTGIQTGNSKFQLPELNFKVTCFCVYIVMFSFSAGCWPDV